MCVIVVGFARREEEEKKLQGIAKIILFIFVVLFIFSSLGEVRPGKMAKEREKKIPTRYNPKKKKKTTNRMTTKIDLYKKF